MTKKYLIALALVLLVVPFISAGDVGGVETGFDNVIGEYNETTHTAVIENTFGLGGVIAEFQLLTPLAYEVGVGYVKVAEIQATSFTDYNNALDEIKFYDINNEMEEVTRTFDYKYKYYENVTVDDYTWLCEMVPLSSPICDWEVTGTKEIEVERWGDFVGTGLSENENVTLGIFTTTYEGELIEWIPKFMGVEIEQWASWSAGLNSGLQNYYKFDEQDTTGSGAILDAIENNDATNNGAANVTGIINTAYNYTKGGSDYIETDGNVGITGSSDRTINFWVDDFTSYAASNEWLLTYGEGGGGAKKWSLFSKNAGSGELAFSGSAADFQTSYLLDDDLHMITMTYNGSEVGLFADGVIMPDGVATLALATVDSHLFIGATLAGAENMNGWIDEMGVWDRELTSAEITQLYNGGAGIQYSEDVVLNSPANQTSQVTASVTFNGTIAGSAPTNVSLIIDDLIDQTNTSGVLGDYLFTKTLDIGEHTWNMQTCVGATCVNGTAQTIEILRYKLEENTFNASTAETASETFRANITANSSLTSVILDYNGTNYTMTSASGNWSTTFDIPLGKVQNNTLKYYYIYDGDTFTSSDFYQDVSLTMFTACNATYATQFLNFSFADESNSTAITASIPTSSYTYYLGSGDVVKTSTYTNNTEAYTYQMCATPTDRTFNMNHTIQYESGAYPQRIDVSTSTAYTNSVTNKTLYLLNEDDGGYVTFQVVNGLDQLLEGVHAVGRINIGGVWTVVADGTTNAAGTVQFWLDPNTQHNMTFTKTGYSDNSQLIFPVENEYTIVLGGGDLVLGTDYTKGMIPDYYPKAQELFNDTSYTFAFNLTSNVWDLDSFGYNLRLANGTIVSTASSTVEDTAASSSYNVSNQSIIYMDAYWIVEGNTTWATPTYWIVTNTEYTGWSIKQFFTYLGDVLDSEPFGLDNFGRILITFLVLFIAVGIFSYKYGITSPVPLSILIFSIVYFLDGVVGLIPAIRGIDNLITYLAGLIMAITIIGEISR